MKSIHAALTALLFSLATLGQSFAESLEASFQSPPNSAKPHTWWHWMNGYVSAEGITKDLEAMQRTGIGGLQAFQIEYKMDPGPVKYLSKEWRQLMKHTLQEADRLGMEVCYHQTAGWSSSGGPWITPEFAMQDVVWTEKQVKGSKKVVLQLQQPKDLRNNYFQDIAVLAFPTPASEQNQGDGFRVQDWRAKAGYERNNDIQRDTRKVAPGDTIASDSIIDLSDKMDPKGRLEWTAPRGNWTVVRFGHAVCGLRNRPAPKEGRGNECDKMSKAAAALHWENTVQKVIDDAGPLVGKSFNNVLIDSYETGQQNWTPGFEKEFQKRMGYDVISHLPSVTGRVVDSLDRTERFLWDFRRVIADMWTENYFAYFAEMCHREGLLLSCEPYGAPGNMDDFAVADVVDIPMGEWWARSTGGPFASSAKMAASAAHTNGRRYVGAEAFTAGRLEAAFINHPYYLKAQGDYYFCQGINRFIFHSYVHQPWDDDILPGMTMGPWGLQNHRNNTWYEQGKAWNEYLARSQYLLQEGDFRADICYYPGENAPARAKNREDLVPPAPSGYDFDTISRSNLMKLTVQDGRLRLPGLMEYRLLVMPEGLIRQEVLEKVRALVNEGAQVVWAKPKGTPSLSGYPNSEKAIKDAVDQMWGACDGESVMEASLGKGKIYWPRPLDSILQSFGVLPDVEIHPFQTMAPTLRSGNGYEWIHRNIDSKDFYLISNQQEAARQVKAVFRVQNKVPQLWNARTGEIRLAPLYHPTDDGRTAVSLFLEPAESVFVVFDQEAQEPSIVELRHNGQSLFAKQAPDRKGLTIHRAVYGILDGKDNEKLDITARLKSRISGDSLDTVVNRNLVGQDPAKGRVKQLRVDYSIGEEKLTKIVGENENLALNNEIQIAPAPPEPAYLELAGGKTVLTAWEPGDYELVYSDDKRSSMTVAKVPQSMDLSEDWLLQCPKKWGPSEVKLDNLGSWSEHSDPALKYFSGTGVYRKTFDAPEQLNDELSVELNLGNVQILAEVILNGENLGILWKPPFKVDISDSLRAQNNQLEIRVTNLWVNRMIGDEQHPTLDNYIAGNKPGENLIEAIPDWLKNGEPRPSTERKTFVTCRFYEQDSPLLESGLIGPVEIHFGVKKEF